MACDKQQITLTEDKNERLEPAKEADTGPSTSKEPLDEIEIEITLTQDEIEKLKLLEVPDTGPSTSNKPLIQMVPQILRSCYSKEEWERYFKPTSIVIGPLNHPRETDKDSRIERGEECKLKLAANFIKFSESTKEVFYKNVKKQIYGLRNCYNLNSVQEWNDEELAWMFLVDGCALLQFIAIDVSNAWEEFSVEYGPVSIEIVDFFLLENQLPYRLLDILIDSFGEASTSNLQFREIHPGKLFKRFITEFINRSFLSLSAQQQHHIQVDYSQPHLELQQEEYPPHLLDLLRRRLTGEKGEKQERIDKRDFWHKVTGDQSKHLPSIRNAKELKDKGVHFKARVKGSAITDIDFKGRCCMTTLTLAPILLHNTTVPLLLNLMAYELCPDFKETCKITSHLSFLDSLIDDAEDVKELRDAGVLHNGLGSDEAVAELLNKISGIVVPNFKIDSELRSAIHEYCNSNKSYFSSLRASVEAKLNHTYFRSPWSFLVFFAALAGLIMTGMQTYYSFQGNKFYH